MEDELKKIGIFGGTFNPIHIAHLRLAEDVRESCDLGKVLFIPTNIPPHKKMEYEIKPIHRLKMVEIAIDNNPHFVCEEVEINRGGVSYTIDTVDYIYQKYRFKDKPYLIIGSDLLQEIGLWKNIDILKKKVNFVVLFRGTYKSSSDYKKEEKREGITFEERGNATVYRKYVNKNGVEIYISLMENRILDVTSSEIRKRLREGKSIRYLVPEEVLHYIKSHKLYE